MDPGALSEALHMTDWHFFAKRRITFHIRISVSHIRTHLALGCPRQQQQQQQDAAASDRISFIFYFFPPAYKTELSPNSIPLSDVSSQPELWQSYNTRLHHGPPVIAIMKPCSRETSNGSPNVSIMVASSCWFSTRTVVLQHGKCFSASILMMATGGGGSKRQKTVKQNTIQTWLKCSLTQLESLVGGDPSGPVFSAPWDPQVTWSTVQRYFN